MVFLNALTKAIFNLGTTRSRTKVNGSVCFAEGSIKKTVTSALNAFQVE